ncbi:class I SAM-dependent methyltransferase [Calditrichota bacterium]
MQQDFRKEIVEFINEESERYKLIETKYGYYSVDPMPSEEELAEFYSRRYFSSEKETANRSMDAGQQDELERYYFDRQYDEVIQFIEQHFNTKKINILDAGCGTAGLLKHLQKNGFRNLHGTEYDALLNIPGIKIYNGGFLDFEPEINYDLITFNAVFEHVREPEKFLKYAHGMLNDGGMIRMETPNDLSYTQYVATKGKKFSNLYFFNPPEHLHYYNFDSLTRLLEANNFEVIKKRTTWCMEMFIMMGLDFAETKSMGKICHVLRNNFEFAVKDEFLIEFYEKMAEIGVGRTIIQYARKV